MMPQLNQAEVGMREIRYDAEFCTLLIERALPYRDFGIFSRATAGDQTVTIHELDTSIECVAD